MDDERIEVRWFDRKELGKLIRTGEIEDAKTLIGYFCWMDRRRQARKRSKEK